MSREIKYEELALHDGRADGKDGVWTSIDGTVYDITEWRNTHPGGQVIRLAAGREAATLVESYHQASIMPRVQNSLANKCPVVGRLVGAPPIPDSAFFKRVRERVDAHLKQNGWSRTTDVISTIELVATLSLYLVATYYVSVRGSLLAAIFLGFLTGRLGFIMHSGNHMGMHSNKHMNKAGGVMMDIIGSTHLLWSFEHQVAHHMDPNVLGKDNDCQIASPHLRFHPHLERKWWHKYNHIVTLAGMSIGFFKWYLSDPFHYYSQTVGHVSFSISRRDWIGLAIAKSIWFLMHIAAPLYFTGVSTTLTLLFTFMILGAYYLESIFIVNHIQAELVPPPNAHWANKQVLATSNWGSGSQLWNWVSGGLNHQIEHHLFPSYSIYTYPVMSPVVKEVCAEFGLPYHNFADFPTAWLAMVTYLKDLGTEKFDNYKIKHI